MNTNGKTFVTDLQSGLATARCQSIDVLAWLEMAFNAHLSGEPAPMLLPPPNGEHDGRALWPGVTIQ